MNAIVFLLNALFTLYLMVVLLRLWLQLTQADFYNPLSQFVVKVTHPLVGPLRRVVPSIGRFDTATLLLAFIVALLRTWAIGAIQGYVTINPILLLMGSVYFLIGEMLQLVIYVLIIRAVLSWVSQGNNPIEYLFHQLTEPLLAPIRRIIPPIGGLDLSPMIVILLVYALMIFFRTI
ncbi:YggT family protein [Aliiglaciecola sp. LCG003]|uniref:YggT family protein n=1 Tax=Aliiglaciecola sp. LCG003 TaxID=3053655 RepID=UPI0025746E96|nr:YggT family protein [Aliiglaciecola sp. LCG003]WJG08668.1 YggT family protein [Aliiglaciecola sp. LCG003]